MTDSDMGLSEVNPGDRKDTEVLGKALQQKRESLTQRLVGGALGSDLIASFTEWVDALIIGRYRNEVSAQVEQGVGNSRSPCCVLALGGYGRRELAPYSDIDLMFLYHPDGEDMMAGISRGVLHHLWDLGFQVGHSLRSISDCLQLAQSDLPIRTSMMEARYLAGDAGLFQSFQREFWGKVARRRTDLFIQDKVHERQKEYEKFGETVYLLEPNVKKSQGGLRDLHLIQWIAMVKYRAQTIQDLADRGTLSRQDYTTLIDAREFLWRVRVALHLHADMAQEILSFDEQVWLAELFGFQDRPNLLAVEQCMQQYYQHTRGLYEILNRFIERARDISFLDKLRSWLPATTIEGHFQKQGQYLTVPSEHLTAVLGHPDLLLRLFELAQSLRLQIETTLLDEIQQHMSMISDEAFLTEKTSVVFRRILRSSWGVATTLEAMHRAHVLEKIIPVFSRVRGLMQFNQYHKYTVDEHSLLAVQQAENMGQAESSVQDVYQEIQHKDVLLLSILLHDLGKGVEEDHSEVGKAIAQDTAIRLNLNLKEQEALVFLVHRHLLMAHTAFRRDPYDKKVLLPFTRRVQNSQRLRMLLILTMADIAAVGPGVLTKWKESLLIQLFTQALPELTGKGRGEGGKEGLERVVKMVYGEPILRQHSELTEDRLEAELNEFPQRYIYGTPPARIAAHFSAIKRLKQGAVVVEDSYDSETGASEYTVITHSNVLPGLFSKLAGVMASQGLKILDAQIVTTSDGVVLDSFQVKDPDYSGEPPDERKNEIKEVLERVLLRKDRVEDLLGRNRRLSLERALPSGQQPVEIHVDNETSEDHSILDVFAEDCQGILYTISHAMFQLGLSVHRAKISTRLDQVADVFYVTEVGGGKITESTRIEHIRTTIIRAIEQRLEDMRRQETCLS